jgi:outer membrane protein OmpA-like peptidoglycan-associated protein
MKIKLWYLFLGIILSAHSTHAQNSENVRLKVRVVNSVDGSEIKNPSVVMTYVLTDNVISLKTEKKNTFYDVKKGAQIKVEVSTFQFYTEVSTYNTDHLYDDDVLEIRLNPRPAGSAVVSIIDAKTKAPLPATLQISFEGTQNSQNTSASKPELEIYFEKNGRYVFNATAPGYETKEIKVDLKLRTANTVEKPIIIELNKSLLAQKLVFKNKVSKELLQGKMTVEIINVSDKSKTTIWSSTKEEFEYASGDSYNVTVEKEGFKPLFSQIKPDGRTLELLLEPRGIAPFMVEVKESGSTAKVNTQIKVTSPSGAEETIVSNTRYQPKEVGQYTFSFTKDGYGSYEQKISSQYRDEAIPVNFEMRGDTEIKIVVLDSISKQPIENAAFKVFKENLTEIKGSRERNAFSFKKAPFENATFEISSPNYSPKSGKINSADVSFNTVTVYLAKRIVENLQEHEYTFVDAHTKEPVKKTQVIILDANKQTVETLFNSSKGSYLTYKINPEKEYSIQVKADGYKDLNAPLSRGPRDVSFELQPTTLDETIISIYDDYTKEMLVVKSLSVQTQNALNIPFTERNREFVTQLKKNESYVIKFQQEGYLAFNQTFTVPESKRIDIFVRKETYPLALIIQNELTEEQKNQAKATITYISGKTISNTFDKARKAFILESDPKDNLQVEIEIPGFRHYKASNNRQQLAMYEINVDLLPIPKVEEVVAVETPKEEPQKVEEIVKIEEPKKAEVPQPKVEEPKKEEVVVKKDVPMEAKKGKRYPLDGVNFEQSKTNMLYGSELKLKELLTFLQQNPNVKIEVIGHTDKIGDERQNQRLSEFRARTVANWLFNKGIDSGRIITTGKGSTEPLAANDSEETKAQNRRIEVLVLED